MPSNTLTQIKALIKTKIESLVDGGGVSIFGDTLDYPTAKFKGYPAAVIIQKGVTGSWLDTGRNERTFRFTIDLYQEQTKAGRTQEQADEIMSTSADAILTAFDQDKDLGGELQIVRVVNATFDFKSGGSETYNYATFEIDCVAIVPNY
jgi:hypothetical protein